MLRSFIAYSSSLVIPLQLAHRGACAPAAAASTMDGLEFERFFIEKIRLDSGSISAQTKPDTEAAVGLAVYIISQPSLTRMGWSVEPRPG